MLLFTDFFFFFLELWLENSGNEILGGVDCLLYTFWNFDSIHIWKYCSHEEDLPRKLSYLLLKVSEKTKIHHVPSACWCQSLCPYCGPWWWEKWLQLLVNLTYTFLHPVMPCCSHQVRLSPGVFESSAVLLRLAVIALECTYLLVLTINTSYKIPPILEELDLGTI